MTKPIAVTAVLVAAGFVILRSFTHPAAGDIASAIVAEATAILAVLTYVSLREAQRQGRLSDHGVLDAKKKHEKRHSQDHGEFHHRLPARD